MKRITINGAVLLLGVFAFWMACQGRWLPAGGAVLFAAIGFWLDNRSR